MSDGLTVLVIAAHGGDEVLGCGGVIARHADAGDEAHVLLLAEGGTARDAERDARVRKAEVAAMQVAAGEAAAILGARPPSFGGLPDNRMDTLPLLFVIKEIESAIESLGPAVVYTPHAGNLNLDHRLTHEATLVACRPVPGHPVRALYTYETVSSTEWGPAHAPAFRPTRFVDITDTLDRKVAALGCYRSEMREYPHARSFDNLTALATFRGASAGLVAAEAFEVVREIA